MFNAEFAKQPQFFRACESVFGSIFGKDIMEGAKRPHKKLPLTRQASKFRRRKGIVFQKTGGRI